MPRGIVAVGYFTQRRSDAHDYRPDIEVEVAEAVTQDLPALDRDRVSLEPRLAPFVDVLAAHFRQAPQPAPDTALGPPFQVHVPVVTRQHHCRRPQRLRHFRLARREFGN